MNLNRGLTRKCVRTIGRDINTILSEKGFRIPTATAELKGIDFHFPLVNVNNGFVFLSKDGREAFGRICDKIYRRGEFANCVSYSDLSRSVLSEIEKWFGKNLVPDAVEFIDQLDMMLKENMHEHFYASEVRGLKLTGVESLSFGNKIIKPFNSLDFNKVISSDRVLKKFILEKYSGKLIITGSEFGTSAISIERYYHNVEWSLSLLRLYACIITDGTSIDKVDISLASDDSTLIGDRRSFGWRGHDNVLSYAVSSARVHEFIVDAEVVEYFRTNLAFNEMAGLIEKTNKNEVEVALVKSTHWVGEAQKDLSAASAWVKLWFALECFFSLGYDEITENNARGIASIMLFGGLEHDKYKDYKKLKTIIKNYYGLRCKIVHSAEYQNIDIGSLEELAYITSSVVVGIVHLLNKGFSSLEQIKNESLRLDKTQINF